MPFFNEDDYENVRKTQSTVPDGVIDGSSYVKVFTDFAKNLSNLDTDDVNSRIQFMMDIVNPVYLDENAQVMDKTYVFDLITCMSFHIVQLLVHGYRSSDEFKNSYIDLLNKEIIPGIIKECESLPYWE